MKDLLVPLALPVPPESLAPQVDQKVEPHQVLLVHGGREHHAAQVDTPVDAYREVVVLFAHLGMQGQGVEAPQQQYYACNLFPVHCVQEAWLGDAGVNRSPVLSARSSS